MNIKDSIITILKEKSTVPFLFIGSGFSRRYLDLEDWKGLLEKFCLMGKTFDYYLTTANGSMPKAANLLAEDFHEHWWKTEEYKSKIIFNNPNKTSALRIAICNYLKRLDPPEENRSKYSHELALLNSINIDGIITTNWDLFLEKIFPTYKVYIGQEELLFKNPYELAEIYKIHGCSSDPESLILTDKDYENFNDKNAYLAAKLITLFVERPIIFLGYSMSDSNINTLLKSISLCVGKANIEKLRNNLIFVERPKNREPSGISNTYISTETVQIPLLSIKTDDFSPIYEALQAMPRKIPARVLRDCKEQLYELVRSAEPEKKIFVLDIDKIDKEKDIEFVIGVGVAQKAKQELVAQKGYTSIEIQDLIADLIHENNHFHPEKILKDVIPNKMKNGKYIPVFKYLKIMNINSENDYKKSGLSFNKMLNEMLNNPSLENFRDQNYKKQFSTRFKDKDMTDIIHGSDPEEASRYIPFLSKDKLKLDLDKLKDFLITHEAKMTKEGSPNYYSSFRRLAALYDWLKWGWD